ncbi:MAG: DNA-3-methyladenine glycosylase I [Chloroflexi bacterium]|nr:DNA-3-methyladenine glycosylase I [Chloroflexota bacterium]
MIKRCPWPGEDPLYVSYHDEEWGLPVHDDQLLFAKLILDGAQAGLSWITILRKRENYWQAFDQFDPEKIARYDEKKFIELMGNSGIIRNRQKINAAIKNAKAYLNLHDELGSFDQYLWNFVNGETILNDWTSLEQIPAKTPESEAMSKDLKRRGFSFVGPTICYAFMQAVGMVNDHLVDCFRYEAVQHK